MYEFTKSATGGGSNAPDRSQERRQDNRRATMIDTKKTVEIKNLTGGLWNRFCDARMSFPVPLHESDLTKPFIYDRAYGVFYVAFGHHQVAMHTLLAIHGVEIDD